VYRFFVDQAQIGQKEITITGGDVNHIRNVLRMRPGEDVVVSDGKGKDYYCKLKEIGCGEVVAGILEEKAPEGELPARIYLFQGLPKSGKMELIIQKAVELGVYQVIPVAARRSVAKLDKKKEESKARRWNGIAESAAKQSGRGIIPKVAKAMSFKEALACARGFEVKVIPFEHAMGMEETRRQLERIRSGMDVGIFIGPEGGFEDEEVSLAEAEGVKAVSLGKRILRTETAGLMVLSVIGYLLEVGEDKGKVKDGSIF